MSEKYHLVIGIDLGTTYSALSVYNRFEEEAEIVPNPQSVDSLGRSKPETTPSVVSLDAATRRAVVGWPAKRNLSDPENTITEIKREMGEMFSEETLKKYNCAGKFRAKQEGADGFEGDPVKVCFDGEWYLPQEISALILMHMKGLAESHIGEPIRDAVITVPAYFTEKQKKATEEAAYLAGLYPRQILGEPTAAAICYGVDRLDTERKVYLVYDLGGGTFDVSIISVDESKIVVLATSGDPRLGGGDFDDAIVDWAVAELRDKFQLDATEDREKLARIKAHAEQAKKDLSSLNSTTMTFIDVWPQQPPSLELSREKFEELITPLLNKSITYVDVAMKQAEEKRGLRPEDLDAILLVGGSTKSPCVKSLLLAHFQQEESFVSSGLNPDEVVARGAATVGLKFAPSQGEFDIAKRPDNSLVNTEMDDDLDWELITEHSLGVGVQNNLIRRLIEQGTGIPVALREGGFTNSGPTEHVVVPVYQGEGDYTYQATLIGTLSIGPMEPKPEGTHQFEVTFSLDDNGLLSMTVHHINEGKSYQAQFEQKTGVGGPDALMARRAKLLRLCGDGSTQPPGRGPVPPSQPIAPPGGPVPPTGVVPPGQPGIGGAAAIPPVPGMPQPGAPQQGVPHPGNPQPGMPQPGMPQPGMPQQGMPQPGMPQPGMPQPGMPQQGMPQQGMPQPAIPQPGVPPEAAVPPSVPAPAAGNGGSSPGNVLEPTVEIPSEFRSIVRRSHKLLLNDGSETLRDVFNRFVNLLNSGATADDLEEAGDDLADAYHDSR